MARYASIALSAPLAFTALPVHMALTFLASCVPVQRIRVVQYNPTGSSSNTLTIATFNACLMEGLFAPTTGGVVPPFDPAGGHQTRVEAIAERIGKQGPDVFVGQEFYDLRGIREFIKEMKRYGYTSFAYDPSPHLLCLNSGLFVASKRKISNVTFNPFILRDRAGKAKFNRMGTLAFTVLDAQDKPLVRIYNAHLNAPAPNAQAARNKQLQNYILPEFSDTTIPSILLGDLNFDTAQFKQESGLANYVNAFEGQVTCTNEGKRTLRRRNGPLVLEKVDGVFANSNRIRLANPRAEPLRERGELLSDHYLLTVTAEIE
jgi:endonuclease/exonuclease/phosphatase family metal-dependent hydrolase